MASEKDKKHTGKCFDCGNFLELVEYDVQKEKKVLKCRSCGLHHYYKKDILSRWKLLKVSKQFTT